MHGVAREDRGHKFKPATAVTALVSCRHKRQPVPTRWEEHLQKDPGGLQPRSALRLFRFAPKERERRVRGMCKNVCVLRTKIISVDLLPAAFAPRLRSGSQVAGRLPGSLYQIV